MKKKIFFKLGILFFIVISIITLFWKNNPDNKEMLLADSNVKIGDVNGDGKVNSMDYILVRKHILGVSKLSGDQLTKADASNDGKVNSMDYITIKKIIIGLTSETSVENAHTFTATFTVQDTNASSSLAKVSCTTSGSSCEITVPTLTANKTNTTIIGWNTDKNATTASIKSGGKVTISKDTAYYSITQTLVNVTFNVGEDIPGINFKADQLSFYNNEHTRCISYNGGGCNIKLIPTIIKPGQVIHGFSTTPGGAVINVAKTKYTEDTILYARIYDDISGQRRLQGIGVSKYEIIGTVAVEVEAGIPEHVGNRFINFMRGLYQDFPNLLLWNGTVSLLTYSTYLNMYGSGTAGLTFHGSSFSKDFSHTVLYYEYDDYTNEDYFLGTAVHEITHAYNYGLYWNGGLDSAISKTSTITDLYNKYKNESNRPLRNYSYNNASEFYSDLMSEYYRQHRAFQYNDYPYACISNGWAADLTAAAEHFNHLGINYYRSTGRLP